MSDVLIQPRIVAARRREAEPRRLPVGVGLGVGALISFALWGVVVWGLLQLI